MTGGKTDIPQTPTVGQIASAIEAYAPLRLQESYDNSGLQVGSPLTPVSAVLLCLDVNEEVVAEARSRGCNLIVSHHPLLFRGLKRLTGATPTERVVAEALRSDIAVYSAHTNLDSASGGVSHEMAATLGLTDLEVLSPNASEPAFGLGLVGNVEPTPALAFLRRVKEAFGVKSLRYSAESPRIVVKRVALCGGAGASLIGDAIRSGADVYITGDLKYHDFTSYGSEILLADTGHYESELGAEKIFSRIIREHWPDLTVYFSQSQQSPIASL